MTELGELAEQYGSALQEYLSGAEEPALRQAYELGRRALGSGFGIVEVAAIHREALAQAVLHTRLPEEGARVARRAMDYFLESATAFEMIDRGFQEANITLRNMNEALEHSAAKLESANRELAREIIERQQMEEEIRKLNVELEARVAARTMELLSANEAAQRELVERERVEQERERLFTQAQDYARRLKAANERLEQQAEALAAQNDDLRASRLAALNLMEDALAARQQAEQVGVEMENEKRRLEAVMEALPVGVAITDAQGGNVRSNSAFERIWSESRPVTRSFGDYALYKAWWADTGQAVAPEEWASAQVIQKGEPVVGQLIEIQRFDGSHAFVINSASPVRDSSGKIMGSAVAIQDITDLRKAEERLAHSLAETQRRAAETEAIFAAMNDAVLIYDTNMNAVKANPYFAETYGFAPLGLNVRDIIQRVSCRRLDGRPLRLEDQPTPRALRGEKVKGERFLITPLGGADMIVETSSAPLRVGDHVIGSITVWHDSTERERLLAASQEYAERLNVANAQLQERTEELEVTMEELAAQNDELRAARQALETERQRYQELFEFAPGGYLVTDQQGTIRESNRTAAVMLNVQADMLVGKPLTVLTAPGEHGALYARLTQLQIEEYTRQWEIALLPRERPSFPALADVAPMRDAEGQLVGFRWLLRDITELRQVQQRLQDSNEQLLSQTGELQALTKELVQARDELERRVQERTAELAQANAELHRALAYNRSLIEASLDPLVTIGPDGKITDVNAATERATAYSRQELIGTDFSDYFTRPERARAVYQRVFDEGTVRNYELELLHRDGHLTFVLYNASVYRDEAGQVIGVFAAARDITKRKLAEEQLRLQSAALEAAANGIIITDVQGNIQWANPAFAQMTGYARGEVLGQATRFLRSGLQSRQVYQQLWETILSGQVWRGQMVNRRKDGSLYTEEQTIAPVLNAEAEITHFVAIKHDITERKRMEEAERHARQIAETLSAATLALAQTLNLETVMETLLDLVGRLVPYDSANVMLLETESRLAMRVLRGYERWGKVEQVRAVTLDVQTNPILNELFTAHKSRLVSDSYALPGWECPPGAEHVRSWIGVPLIADGNIIGVCSLDKAEPGFFTQEHVQSAEMLVGQAAVAIQNAWLFEQVRAGRERLQSLSRRLVEVQEAERRYIARELHDEAGQALTSLIFGLGQLEQSANLSEQSSRIAELKHATNAISESLHQLAMDLRPASLDHLGLVPSLHQYVTTVGDRYSLIAQFKALGFESERLQPAVETALYRIVQEALTNVVRHARATRVDVLLERRGDKVIVVVEDDGVGFDADTARFAQSGRLGLLGMQERAEMLGGSLVVESSAGAGTTMVVEIPYADSYPHR